MKVIIYLLLIVSLLLGAGYYQNKDGAEHPFYSKKIKNPHWKNIKKSLGIQ